jgi:hypothetical protein
MDRHKAIEGRLESPESACTVLLSCRRHSLHPDRRRHRKVKQLDKQDLGSSDAGSE